MNFNPCLQAPHPPRPYVGTMPASSTGETPLARIQYNSKVYSNQDVEYKKMPRRVALHLDVIDQGAHALGSADAVLVPEAEALDAGAVLHPAVKGKNVGVLHLGDLGEASGGRDVAADAPAVLLLELGGEHEGGQQLGALGVRRVLEDAAPLAPGDEIRVVGEGGADVGHVGEADGRGEGRRQGAVLLGDEGEGRGRAADPGGILRKQLVEPGIALFLQAKRAKNTWLADMIRCRPAYSDLHQVKGKENCVVVVGIRQDQLVLVLGLEELVKVVEVGIGKLLGVPGVLPEQHLEGVPRGGRLVLEPWEDLVVSQWRVVQQNTLLGPAREIVDGLQVDAVDLARRLGGHLLVNSAVVVLGEVDSDVELHVGESLLKGILDKVHLVDLVAAVPEDDLATLGHGSLVDLVDCAGFDGGLGAGTGAGAAGLARAVNACGESRAQQER